VRYVDTGGVAPGRVHDLAAQARAIDLLRRQGLVDLELHGFTHMHPDRLAWARDANRAEVQAWYRELHVSRPDGDPLAAGLAAFERQWRGRPTTLIPPGDAFNHETMLRAGQLRLDLVCSYYLAIRAGEQWRWSQHVCSPYLDLAAPHWFTAALPVIGYFHERDVAIDGPRWFSERLDEWEAAGARRFIDFRQLTAALACRPIVELVGGEPIVELRRWPGIRSAWPVPVKVQLPGAAQPSAIMVSAEAARSRSQVTAGIELPTAVAGAGR
jgi:hypothetical protein